MTNGFYMLFSISKTGSCRVSSDDIERIYKQAVVHLIGTRALRDLRSSYVLEFQRKRNFAQAGIRWKFGQP
jgi:hypothetical protein